MPEFEPEVLKFKLPMIYSLSQRIGSLKQKVICLNTGLNIFSLSWIIIIHVILSIFLHMLLYIKQKPGAPVDKQKVISAIPIVNIDGVSEKKRGVIKKCNIIVQGMKFKI